MSGTVRESGRRQRKLTGEDTRHWTLGQSFNGGQQCAPSRGQQTSGSGGEEFNGGQQCAPSRGQQPSGSGGEEFISKLPAAVATVSQEDKKSYVHSKRVTNYLVGNTLGEGSFAKVKEGFHLQVGEKVAIKIIDKKKALQDSYVNKNFRREARLLQMVHHPNILQLLEVVETDNSYYLITELCSGGELMKHIYDKKQLGEEETRKYMRQMVSAVDHMHRAGIIHRDLKVENLLLDSQGNVKIIDFGLSNEEFTLEEGQRVHCSTQCGSPAYAAPELLGHKPYGFEVDIWSLGVNMYAMLTGFLPYTVDPFNITALHAKMLENKMNPIPTTLTPDCIDLLHGLLTSEPSRRIKMSAIMAHPWMAADGNSTLKPHPYPGRLTANDINEDIVEYMVHAMKLKEKEEEVTAELLTDRPTAISAIYHLLQARLDRYNLKAKSKVKVKKRHVPAASHRQPTGDDDCHSTMSYSTRGARDHNPNRVQLQPIEQQKPGEENSWEKSRLRRRRSTLPNELLKEDIEKLRQTHNLPPVQPRAGPLCRSLRNRPDTTLLSHRADPSSQRPTTQLNPVRPPPVFPTSISHPQDLNKLRHEINRHAWGSQPPSQTSLAGPRSRQPSRPSSRQPSAVSNRYHNSPSHNRRSCPEWDDLDFHEVESVASSSTRPTHRQRKVSQGPTEGGGVHFPSLTHPSSRGNHQRSRSHDQHHPTKHPHRTNGHWSPSMQFEFASDTSTSGLLSNLGRVAESLHISRLDQKGNTVYLKGQSIKFQVHVERKSQQNLYVLEFQWLQGGSHDEYTELCCQIFHSLSS